MHGEIFKLKIHQNIFINNYYTITFRNTYFFKNYGANIPTYAKFYWDPTFQTQRILISIVMQPLDSKTICVLNWHR